MKPEINKVKDLGAKNKMAWKRERNAQDEIHRLRNFGGYCRKTIWYFYQKKVRTQAVEALSSRYPLLGMSLMCSWFGFSRQACYAAVKQMEKNVFEFDLVIGEIKRIRKRIPGIGSGKLYELIKPFLFPTVRNWSRSTAPIDEKRGFIG